MISVKELVRRARKRCKHHRDRVGGVCQECILMEVEQAIVEEHSELKRGDLLELVQEWLLQEEDLPH
ncbi:MAG: hypothetical protein O7B23_13010 [Deltaproteobacteria bacterium]|nr:hypothetical protein [Deltaproteobacteria bacterium]